MKRSTNFEDEDSVRKRHKINVDEVFDDPSSAISFPSLLKNNGNGAATVAEKFISGKVNRIWPAGDGMLAFELATSYVSEGHDRTTRLLVCLTESCVQFFDHFDLKPQDNICISLKEAEIRTEDDQSLKLIYSKGVVLRRARKPLDGQPKTINTWKLMEAAAVREDDWFSTPELGIIASAALTPGALIREAGSRSKPVTGTTSLETEVQNLYPPNLSVTTTATLSLGAAMREGVSNSNSVMNTASPEVRAHPETSLNSEKDLGGGIIHPTHNDDVIHERPAEMSKRAFKKQKKAQNEQSRTIMNQEAANAAAKIRGYSMNSPGKTEKDNANTTVIGKQLKSDNANATGQRDMPQETREILVPGGSALPLPDKHLLLNNLMPSSRVNFIGVVTYITSPSKALTGDWKCRLNLGDPSNTIVENFSNNEAGFSINFFTKKYLQWLPCPKQGDILILHDIKVVRWQGTISGVGYPDRFRWAIYLPDKGDVYYGQLGNVPESEGAADGLGYAYSPFLQPSASEIKYALNLSDWWRSVLKKRKDAMGEVQQIGGGVNQFSSLSTKRQHQLICEVSLDSSSHGYFDCTVEVLHGWANSNPNVYSLYVTDYTRNAQTRPCTSQWCSVSLQDYVLQIEMWDAAANIGETMRAGEFYHIQNVRLQVRKSGYLEGKLNENKIRLLSEHETASNHHLQALLDRKEAWTKTHDSDGGFEHQLIRDVVADKFFNCSVEILHVELALDAEKGDLPSYIYVTDYTKHSDISFNPGDLKGSIPWPDNLEGRVVKIAMLGKQAAMAKYVVVGSYYLIKKLRLKYTTVGRELRGWLGGGEKLICQLRADNVELQSLLQRKKEWNSINEINPRTEERSQESKMLRIKQSVSTFDRHFSSIKEVNACPISPNKFRVVAKLVDFYPPTLQNAAIAYCRQCKEDIPETRKACYNCADSDHEFVQYRYQLFVLLQDEAGDTIKLSINDRCSLFDGLKRCDIRENITVCNDFCRRLEPLIGSVTKLREGRIDIDQIPFLSLVIYHWLTSKGQQAYSLADFEGVF